MFPEVRGKLSRLPGALLLTTALALGPACSSFPDPRSARRADPELGAREAWPAYGGGPANIRYSRLDEIDRTNVHRLQVAWVYRTGDAVPDRWTEIQCQPIIVKQVLYCTTPSLKVFALNAATGKEIWKFDPFQEHAPVSQVNRGVVYWSDGTDERIFFTAGSRLYALDARTGRPIPSFGQNGSASLYEGLGLEGREASVIATTPGVVYRDLLIQGSRVSEGEGGAPGHIRAYDARTGEVRWVFHTIPRPGEFGYETWPKDAWKTAGGANSWAGMSLDERRGMVFIPTGSASPDFYGGGRIGQNLFANSVLALNAATGERIWHFQTVHHDLWDRDLPAPPNLVTVTHDGRRIDAVAQVTKSGYVFLFDRLSGKPLFPVEERPVPASVIPGEQAWPTQPVPTKPAQFARSTFTEADVTELSAEAHATVLAQFRAMRQPAVPFTPPSFEGSVVFPGFDGGAEWGGAAFDPATGILYVNANNVPRIAGMVRTDHESGAPRSGAQVYATSCAGCHGIDRTGDGDRSPPLLNVGARLSAGEIRQVIEQGRGFMPSFGKLTSRERSAVIAYLLDRREADEPPPAGESTARPPSSAPVSFAGYRKFLAPDGYPAVKPPWGTLNAIDLNQGEILWQLPLGEYPELKARGVPATGTERYGGPVVTAGGLLFIGATLDANFRAFDKETGKLLWETQLPAAGYATPSTYAVNGKQYIVIAAGGGKAKLGTRSGDSYVAFALPD